MPLQFKRIGALRLAGFGMSLGLAAAAQPAPEWQRVWTVQAVDCPRCQPEDRAWIDERRGQDIVFGPVEFVNPFYEDCLKGVDYSDIHQRTANEARNFLGVGRLPPLTSALPLAGMVRCAEPSGPPNAIARVVLDGSRAFLLIESGAILQLR